MTCTVSSAGKTASHGIPCNDKTLTAHNELYTENRPGTPTVTRCRTPLCVKRILGLHIAVFHIEFFIRTVKIGRRVLGGIGDKRRVMRCQNVPDVADAVAVGVQNCVFAHGKQLLFAGKILFKIGVFALSDVILRKVGEHRRVKPQTVYTLKLQALRRNLHDAVSDAALHHGGKNPV